MLLLALLACGPQPGPLVDELVISSLHTGRGHTLWLGYPEEDAVPPSEGWPTVWVLDGDYHFNAVHRMARSQIADGELPPVLIVGVGYGDGPDMRGVDYIPVADPATAPDGGGAADFYDFLTLEALPAVQEGWPVSDVRVLGGHSYGGLFSAWALFQDPPVFDGFLAASPSLPVGGGAILDDEAAWSEAHPDGVPPSRVLFTMGQADGAIMGLFLDELVERLEEHEELEVREEHFSQDYHVASFKAAWRTALPWLVEVDP